MGKCNQIMRGKRLHWTSIRVGPLCLTVWPIIFNHQIGQATKSQPREEPMRRSHVIGFVCATLLSVAAPALAAWPDRPITLIVPWGAGGAADQISRALAPMLEKDLKVPINVVLRPGGSGAVGHTAI